MTQIPWLCSIPKCDCQRAKGDAEGPAKGHRAGSSTREGGAVPCNNAPQFRPQSPATGQVPRCPPLHYQQDQGARLKGNHSPQGYKGSLR